MKKTVKYEDHLLEKLKDPKVASAYLNACLEDGDANVFLLAVRDVVKAHKSMKDVAEETGINRESLYKSLSTKGNPGFKSVLKIIQSAGIEINFKPKRRR